jgi:hypothetical protein
VRLFPGQAVSLQTTIDLVDVDVDVVAV